jgi:Zn-dependent protease with chaperone function
MNFFQRQSESRRLSRQLVVLFVLAMIAVVFAVDAALFTVLASLQPQSPGLVVPDWEWISTHRSIVIFTTLSVIGVIGLSSLYKTSTLSGGGGVVARSLGGVRVSPDTTDPLERRLLNIVEEMSIASGVPMPEVYLLEQEAGINAFAAGHNPANAAVAVTHGAMTKLNRAELQGVIAHEFSHILNGDMQLNLRLMGMIFGLLVIALLARTVLRFAPRGRSSGSGGKDGAGVAILAILVAAVLVLVVGQIGMFFGRLIQAAVSRSRESLADASAVQFTRDPAGLRGALIKIGALAEGSRIGNCDAEEVAHMLFAPGIRRMFATHPDLEERLRAIDPRFDRSEFAIVRRQLAEAAPAAVETVATPDSRDRLDSLVRLPSGVAISALVGNPGTAHVTAAQELRQSLPESLTLAGRHPQSAQALLLALAIDQESTARDRQITFTGRQLGQRVADAARALLPQVDALAPQQRIPLLMNAFPALRQLTREERVRLMAALNTMWQREGRLSLHSYVMRKLAQVHLHDELNPRVRASRQTIGALSAQLQVLFSVLAQHGHDNEAEARRAYEAGMYHLLPRQRPAFVASTHWPQQLDMALSRLDALMPAAKEQLVEALLQTIAHDGRMTVEEAELLRTVCAALHCPLPPLLMHS